MAIGQQIVSIELHRTQQAHTRRRQPIAIEQAERDLEAENEAKRLEGLFGDDMDAMPPDDLTPFVRNFLQDDFENWQRWPTIYR